jgi:hypothetical protein
MLVVAVLAQVAPQFVRVHGPLAGRDRTASQQVADLALAGHGSSSVAAD